MNGDHLVLIFRGHKEAIIWQKQKQKPLLNALLPLVEFQFSSLGYFWFNSSSNETQNASESQMFFTLPNDNAQCVNNEWWSPCAHFSGSQHSHRWGVSKVKLYRIVIGQCEEHLAFWSILGFIGRGIKSQHCHSLTVIGVIGNMAMTNDCQICKLTRKFCAETGPGLMNSSHLNSDTLIASVFSDLFRSILNLSRHFKYVKKLSNEKFLDIRELDEKFITYYKIPKYIEW
jgi:hypothetical protein